MCVTIFVFAHDVFFSYNKIILSPFIIGRSLISYWLGFGLVDSNVQSFGG